MTNLPEETLWDIRAFVHRHFADTTQAYGVDETAIATALTLEAAASAYEALHNRHVFFLNSGTYNILIANPFSGIEIPFCVQANGKTYGEPINLQVRDGEVSESDVLVHFLVSFKHWYDHMDVEYHGRSLEEIQEIFKAVRPVPDFWQ
jgi:hypothetical protein